MITSILSIGNGGSGSSGSGESGSGESGGPKKRAYRNNEPQELMQSNKISKFSASSKAVVNQVNGKVNARIFSTNVNVTKSTGKENRSEVRSKGNGSCVNDEEEKDDDDEGNNNGKLTCC